MWAWATIATSHSQGFSHLSEISQICMVNLWNPEMPGQISACSNTSMAQRRPDLNVNQYAGPTERSMDRWEPPRKRTLSSFKQDVAQLVVRYLRKVRGSCFGWGSVRDCTRMTARMSWGCVSCSPMELMLFWTICWLHPAPSLLSLGNTNARSHA